MSPLFPAVLLLPKSTFIWVKKSLRMLTDLLDYLLCLYSVIRSQRFICISFLWNLNLLHALCFLNFRIRVVFPACLFNCEQTLFSYLACFSFWSFSLAYNSQLMLLLFFTTKTFLKNVTYFYDIFLTETNCYSSCYAPTIFYSLVPPISLTFLHLEFTDFSRKKLVKM